MNAFPPGGLFNPGWFRVPSGEYAGQVRLSAWVLSAIQAGDGTWVGIASCPLCGAMVLNDEQGTIGDGVRIHERWHARTDAPIPPELQEPESTTTHSVWVNGRYIGQDSSDRDTI